MKKLVRNTIFILTLIVIMVLANSSFLKAATVAPPATFM